MVFRSVARCALMLILTQQISSPAFAETVRDVALEPQVTYSGAPLEAHITWKAAAAGIVPSQVSLMRRLWTPDSRQADFTSVGSLSANALSFVDTTIERGKLYEYSLGVSTTGFYRKAIIPVGKDVPWRSQRGGVLIIIDQSLEVGLTQEMNQLKQDLLLDGYAVVIKTTARMAVDPETPGTVVGPQRLAEVEQVRNIIVNWFQLDQLANRTVLLVGRVPIPYIGLSNEDGHPDHLGAWSSDTYYTQTLGANGQTPPVWSDTLSGSTTVAARIVNIPGDGKLDFGDGSPPEMKVGRVDFSRLTNLPELTLLKRYFARNHEYRARTGKFQTLLPRTVISDSFGTFNGENFARTAWEGSSSLFGPQAAFAGSLFAPGLASPLFLGYACGGGSYTSIAGVGTSTDFNALPVKNPFTGVFGSYFGDWDFPNGLMPSIIAGSSDSLALTTIWANRPDIDFTPLAAGADIGTVALRKAALSRTGNLLGDPSLRIQYFAPPMNVRVTRRGEQLTLTWDPSTSTGIVGYHVLRQLPSSATFAQMTGVPPTLVNPTGSSLTGFTYSDPTNRDPLGTRYAVIAVGSVSEGTVSYFDSSQGALGLEASIPSPPSNLRALGN